MPITLPCESSSGPPLLPGLMAASVWIIPSSRSSSVCSLRLSELTMPVVSVPSKPNGLPMASTFCPTTSASESPSRTVGSLRPASIRISARSLRESVPSTFALYDFISESFTVSCELPRTTWLLVRMVPSALTMKPDPVPSSG